ncbi:MAG TPA: cyclic nucleotide-binding domain-containing protein [Rhodospirillales bacterium]|jgi:CRP-like cAMP-binding protein
MPSPAVTIANDRALTFHCNDCLIKEGGDSKAAYLIVSGRVAIRKGAFSNHPQTIAVLGKGELIGEMSLFDDQPPMASAIALEDTQVRPISRDELKQRIAGLDPVMRSIMRVMVKRLRHMGEAAMPKSTEVNWSDWQKA